MRSPRTWLPATLAVTVLIFTVAACGSGSASPDSGGLPTVSDAWVRPPVGADRPAAGYMTITNPGVDADRLIGASSPIASSVEIHETVAGDSGMMAMQPVDEIEVAPGAPVTLEPGGYHLMLMGVTDMPAVGQTVEITLTFELAGDIVVQAEVRAG
jgi:copper(I)-binding protein